MKKISIKKVSLLCLLALALAACGGQGGGPFVIVDWSGYELESYWEPFAAEHPDVTPEYSFFAEDSEALSKVQSGFQFDLVHPCNSWWALYVEEGLVQPIDTSRLENWDGVYPQLAAQGEFNGEQYFIPWEWGYESITVRSDLVAEMPDSWNDLWDPQYAGKVAIYDSAESTFVLAATALGIDPYSASDEEVQQIKQYLIDLKPNLLTYWGDYTEVNQLLAQGDVWLGANTWNDAYAYLLEEGIEAEFLDPIEGRLGWICGYGISAEAQNLDLAYDYIDALLDPQSSANMANDYYYGVANAEALSLMDPGFVELLQLGDPAVLDRTNFYQSLTNEQREMMATIWNEVKAGE